VEFVRNVTELQVRSSVESVVENSSVLRAMIEAGEIGLIGAMYSVEDGTVAFFEDTYMCGSIKHFSLRPPSTSRDTPQET
jgi:carbonic anhydrase